MRQKSLTGAGLACYSERELNAIGSPIMSQIILPEIDEALCNGCGKCLSGS